jgi:hypothetical protein
MEPIFSTGDTTEVRPDGSGRVYHIAPLSYRERANMQADLARYAGIYPTNAQLFHALRGAVRDLAPGNAAELLRAIDVAEESPGDEDASRALQSIEAACATVPSYSALMAARNHYLSMVPFVAARWGLRGWEGDSLPEFRRERGAVPETLLDVIPPEELTQVGWMAHGLTRVSQSAVGNSVSPSPSDATPKPVKAVSSRTTAAGGSSRGANGKATRA